MADDPIDAAEMIAAYRAVARPSAAVKREIAVVLDAPPVARRRTWLFAAVALAAAAVLLLAWRLGGDGTRVELRERAREQAPYEGDPQRDEARAQPAVVPQVAVPPAIAPLPPAPPRSAERDADVRPPRPQRSVATTTTTLDELALLERARTQLRDGGAAKALASIEQHTREFPRTRLGEERDALRVLASCTLGEHRASSLRDAFLHSHPRSTYAERVRAACGEATDESNIP